jgi:hypothetical protein
VAYLFRGSLREVAELLDQSITIRRAVHGGGWVGCRQPMDLVFEVYGLFELLNSLKVDKSELSQEF